MKSVVVSGCCASCMLSLSVIVCQVVISLTDMLLYYMVVGLGQRFVIPLKRCMPMYHLTVIPRPTTTVLFVFIL